MKQIAKKKTPTPRVDGRRSTYTLRNIDPELWAQVKARARAGGHSVHWVLGRLLERFVASKEELSPAATPRTH